MKLEWMAKHRRLVEKMIKYGNAYAHLCNKQMDYHAGVELSAAQIQVIEYVLENEAEKMSDIAKRLGVTRSAFSKNVQKLEAKQLLEKFQRQHNQKDIFLRVTPQGEAAYERYAAFIYEQCFKDLFAVVEPVPQECIDRLTEMLDLFAERIISFEQKAATGASPAATTVSEVLP